MQPSQQTRELDGHHGYDSMREEMHGIFMANGPAFKRGSSVPSLSNTDAYQVFCHVLDIEEAPNNGTFERVKPLLKNTHEGLFGFSANDVQPPRHG